MCLTTMFKHAIHGRKTEAKRGISLVCVLIIITDLPAILQCGQRELGVAADLADKTCS